MKEQPISESYVPRERKPAPETRQDNLLSVERKVRANLMMGNFTHVSEEKMALSQLQKSLAPRMFKYLMKVVKIFMLNVITLKETLRLLRDVRL